MIIPSGENQDIEFKEVWKDDFIEWICSFANASGGKLYIGVNDRGEVVGVKNIKRLLEDIPNKIVSILGIVCDVTSHRENGLDYIVVDVKSSEIPISCRGAYYYRSGATCQRLTGPALLNFLEWKMKYSWDDVVNSNATLDDIDDQAIKYFLKKGIAAERLPAEAATYDTKQTLTNLNLITEQGKLKNAALLLFGKDPLKFFPSVYYRIGRFVQDDADLVIQDSVEGNIIQMTDRVIDILKAKYLVSPIHYEGLQRIEPLEIPEGVLRELIFNSIIHKDYRGVHIQLRVYNDKIILWNEGALPPILSPEKLLKKHPSYPRNTNIANVFYKAGFIEAWGRGIEKIVTGLAKAGLPAPFYEDCVGGVRVTVERPKAVAALFANGKDSDKQKGEKNMIFPVNWPESWSQSWSQSWPQSWPQSWSRVFPNNVENKTLVVLFMGEKSRKELLELLGYKTFVNSFRKVINSLLTKRFLERSLPNKPNSRLQKYRLTELGRQYIFKCTSEG